MDDDSLKKVVAAIRHQQVTQLHIMSCFLELVDVVPVGEHRTRYLERIEGLLDSVNKQHDAVNKLAGGDESEDFDAS